MDWNHSVIFIIPISLVDVARKISHALDPDSGGYEAFASLVSPTGSAPATHAVYGTPVRENFFQLIAQITDSNVLVSTRANNLKQVIDAEYSARWPEEAPPSLLEITAFLTILQVFFDKSWDEMLTEISLIVII